MNMASIIDSRMGPRFWLDFIVDFYGILTKPFKIPKNGAVPVSENWKIEQWGKIKFAVSLNFWILAQYLVNGPQAL